MLLVLDTNIYIFAFVTTPRPACKAVIDSLADHPSAQSLRIPRTIVEEVRSNVPHDTFREFIDFLRDMAIIIDEDFLVPFELGSKYELAGLKPADAFIAAYTEWAAADALVSANRHFLTRHPNLPFKVLTAEQCLKHL